MPDVATLAGRIDAEFAALEEKVKKVRSEQLEQQKERHSRLEQLGKVFDELRDEIWKPRLELLVAKFGDRVEVKPRVTPSAREANLEFQSRVARVRLRFSATTDREVRKLVLSYDLEILPVLMRYNAHDEVEFPLDAIDKQAIAEWADDRIVDFVQTYLSMGENDIYLKDIMVEDPISHVRFPKVAAGATLEWRGEMHYFMDEETRKAFQSKYGIGSR